MENIRKHYAESGWPHIGEVRKVREISQKSM